MMVGHVFVSITFFMEVSIEEHVDGPFLFIKAIFAIYKAINPMIISFN